jgi:hypothetical protein
MSGGRISEMSDDDLVRQYAELGAMQGRALRLLVSSSRVSRVGDQIYEISKELKRRPGDHRSALLKLLSHPNDWVRFNAATSTISLAPVQAASDADHCRFQSLPAGRARGHVFEHVRR